jgi:hypothetical protein
MIIELEPKQMTPELMKDLEKRGLIIRLCPGNHSTDPGRNESKSAVIYASDAKYGPHKLIVATINALEPYPNFGTHDDNEEFILVGDPTAKPIHLIVALNKKGVLEEKIQNHTLSDDDFVALRIKYNDPEVSFFTMLKDVPHGEVTIDGPGKPGSFYVTEPRDLVILSTDFRDYQVTVKSQN